VSWFWFLVALAALAYGAWRIVRSFKRWPATPGEGRSFFWARRGGGDM